jgi:hypothetical protein
MNDTDRIFEAADVTTAAMGVLERLWQDAHAVAVELEVLRKTAAILGRADLADALSQAIETTQTVKELSDDRAYELAMLVDEPEGQGNV